jgi:hypothetical protein
MGGGGYVLRVSSSDHAMLTAAMVSVREFSQEVIWSLYNHIECPYNLDASHGNTANDNTLPTVSVTRF